MKFKNCSLSIPSAAAPKRNFSCTPRWIYTLYCFSFFLCAQFCACTCQQCQNFSENPTRIIMQMKRNYAGWKERKKESCRRRRGTESEKIKGLTFYFNRQVGDFIMKRAHLQHTHSASSPFAAQFVSFTCSVVFWVKGIESETHTHCSLWHGQFTSNGKLSLKKEQKYFSLCRNQNEKRWKVKGEWRAAESIVKLLISHFI